MKSKTFGSIAAIALLASSLMVTPAIAAMNSPSDSVEPISHFGIDASNVKVDVSYVDVDRLNQDEKQALELLAERVEQDGGGVILSVSSTEYVPEASSNKAATTFALPGGCKLVTGEYHTPNSSNYSHVSGWAHNRCDQAFSHRIELDIHKKKAGASGSGTIVASETEFHNEVETDYTCKTGYVAEFNTVSQGRVTIAGKGYIATGASGWRRYNCGG